METLAHEERPGAGERGTSVDMKVVRGALGWGRSMMSTSESGEVAEGGVADVGGGMGAEKPDAGFPASLLENPKREHCWGREVVSRTMPRLMTSLDLEVGAEDGEERRGNEGEGDGLEIGGRRTSYWF